MFKVVLLALALLPFAAERAKAQVLTPSLSLGYFKEGGRRMVEATQDPGDSTKHSNTYTFVNLGVCYNLSGVCLGLKYLQGEIESKTTVPGFSGSSKTVFTAPGLTLGYSGAGIVAHASWLLAAKKTIEGDSTVYTAKSAWAAELGYGFSVSSVRIGPLLSVYDFTWKERDIAGAKTKLRPQEEDSFILPQVALWVDI